MNKIPLFCALVYCRAIQLNWYNSPICERHMRRAVFLYPKSRKPMHHQKLSIDTVVITSALIPFIMPWISATLVIISVCFAIYWMGGQWRLKLPLCFLSVFRLAIFFLEPLYMWICEVVVCKELQRAAQKFQITANVVFSPE